MNEDDVTSSVNDAAQDTGVQETQPVEQQNEQPTETETESTNDISNDEPESSDNSTDDLNDWAQKKGIDLSTAEGQAKALKSMRESERAFHAKSQQASELEKQLSNNSYNDNDSEGQKALAIATQLQNEKVIRDWKDSANVTKEEDAAMGKYAKENPRVTELLMNGQITLDEFRSIAVPSQQVDQNAIRKEGGQEALEQLANKQRATAVKGGASSSQSNTALNKSNVEQWYQDLGSEGRKNPENQRTLERILAS